MEWLSRVGYVAIGGALGSVARYLIAVASAPHFAQPGLPRGIVGTLLVNGLGSMLLAAAMQYYLTHEDSPAGVRLLLTTGMMGGFTTYSTFNYELLVFLREGRPMAGIAYIMVTVLVCLLAAFAGAASARWWVS